MGDEQRLRMAELGSDAASAMRVVAHFDALAEGAASEDSGAEPPGAEPPGAEPPGAEPPGAEPPGAEPSDAGPADAEAVIRSAALLAGCVVGARRPSGRVVRYDGRGEPQPEPPPGPQPGPQPGPHSAAAPGGGDGTVWLERPGPAHELDPVLLDRLAHTLRVLDAGPPVPRAGLRLGDPALVEVLLSAEERRADRVRAVELSGLDPSRDVRVLAVYADRVGPVAELIARLCPGPLIRSAPIGNLTAVLTQTPCDTRRLCDELHTALSGDLSTQGGPAAGAGPGWGSASGSGCTRRRRPGPRRGVRCASPRPRCTAGGP
ncbi:hypothetical protein [Streptomyces cavernicola]|uniref:Uncharacterized protein n=1 Tax=Streptomyces cavernicola TaxID=3043613 RepID=A0ABT6SFG5_9ACTN|nr:hypothetical protein [Streptomyces sp. B-S-A6]MDI3406694.1 hypothetical protein [Streptomyces sp. B-S-A6]